MLLFLDIGDICTPLMYSYVINLFNSAVVSKTHFSPQNAPKPFGGRALYFRIPGKRKGERGHLQIFETWVYP